MTLQMLYGLDAEGNQENGLIGLLMKELAVTKKAALEAYAKAKAVLEHSPDLDERIQDVSFSYDFYRIHLVEKNILRLALYEILYENQEPKIAISEAIRLSKKFATPAALRFVNALLSAMINKAKGGDIDEEEVKEASLERSKEDEVRP